MESDLALKGPQRSSVTGICNTETPRHIELKKPTLCNLCNWENPDLSMGLWLSLLKTPKAAEKSAISGCAAVVSPACLSSCIPCLGACAPIPQSGGSGTGEPRPASSAARASSPAAGSAPAVRGRPLALGLAIPLVAALPGRDGVGEAGNGDPLAPSRVSALLALALKVRTAIGRSRSS